MSLHLLAPKTNWAKQKITYQAAFDFNLLSPEIQETKSILVLSEITFQKETGRHALIVLYFDFIIC